MTCCKFALVFIIALVSLAGRGNASKAQTFEKKRDTHFRAGKSVFNYDNLANNGPSHWGDISPDFAACKKGHHQSPINMQINSTTSEGLMPEVNLNEAVVSYTPSGANFVFNCNAGVGQNFCSTIKYYGQVYLMIQAHFHSPSEHHIEGVAFPLEIHIVHKPESGKGLLVMAILFRIGEFNQVVQSLLDSALQQGKQVVDFPHFLQPGAALCTYEGSLTTPPCTEGVHWLISTGQLPVSLKQVGQYREMVGEKTNNRPIQAETAVSHPEARCYTNLSLTGGVAGKPGRSAANANTQSKEASVQPAAGSASSGTTAASADSRPSRTEKSTFRTNETTPPLAAPTTPSAQSGGPSPGETAVASTSNGSTAACFPKAATVMLSDGSMVSMAGLQIGHEVSAGRGKFSRVYLFSHRDESAVTTHVRATLTSGRVLTLSPGHFLSVNGVPSPAFTIAVGDSLEGVRDREVVAQVEKVVMQGLYNPHTTSGTIAVNGVICFTYTEAVPLGVAEALLTPLRTLFQLGAVTEASTGTFLRYGAQHPYL